MPTPQQPQRARSSQSQRGVGKSGPLPDRRGNGAIVLAEGRDQSDLPKSEAGNPAGLTLDPPLQRGDPGGEGEREGRGNSVSRSQRGDHAASEALANQRATSSTGSP